LLDLGIARLNLLEEDLTTLDSSVLAVSRTIEGKDKILTFINEIENSVNSMEEEIQFDLKKEFPFGIRRE